MPLLPGRELSHYRLVAPIGEGGMGVVWRATDTTLGRDVAIKVLPETFANDPERMARFEREARVLASLNHPHIASIYGVGSSQGVRFLAMELVEGADLAQRLEHGPIPVAEAIEIARQIAEALESAHEKGVIHRDLKPANVKLTPEGQAKVLDFGLAKAIEGESSAASSGSLSPTLTSPVTAPHVILGTAAYMSPEQARGRAMDRRGDIWAFGCVLYECLTGRRAYAGETISDTIARILERDPDLGALPAGTPERVRELLRRCLEKDPRRRLRDIGDARITLEDVLATRTISGRLLASDGPAGAEARRGPAPWVIAAVVFGAAAAGAAGWAWLAPLRTAGDKVACLSITMPTDRKVEFARITPDGQSLILMGRPRGADEAKLEAVRLYTRSLRNYEFKELPGTQDLLGFLPRRDGRELLAVSPMGGGSPQYRYSRVPLDAASPPTALGEWQRTWRFPIELESGELLVGNDAMEFVRIPASGGAASAPVKADAGRSGVSRISPTATLPGGRAVLVDVVSYDARGWHYSVGVMNLSDGKVEIVEEDGGSAVYSRTGYLVFSRGDIVMAVAFDPAKHKPRGTAVAVWSGLSTPFAFLPGNFTLASDGSLFYRPGKLGGERRMAFVDATGHVVSWPGEPRAVDSGPTISPDGRRFACSIPNGRGIDEIWIGDFARASYERLGSDPDADCASAVWSPDGRRLAYVRYGKDSRDGVYVQGVDGGEALCVLPAGSKGTRVQAAAWRADGASLVIATRGTDHGNVGTLQLGGGPSDSTRLHLLPRAEFNRYAPALSPDDRKLAYVSDESGREQVFVVELRPDGSTGRPVQVGGTQTGVPAWSHDGRTLFVCDERNRMMKVVVGAGPEITLSAPQELFDTDRLAMSTSLWTTMPDGRFFTALRTEDEGDVTRYNLVLNWSAELTRRMKAAR